MFASNLAVKTLLSHDNKTQQTYLTKSRKCLKLLFILYFGSLQGCVCVLYHTTQCHTIYNMQKLFCKSCKFVLMIIVHIFTNLSIVNRQKWICIKFSKSKKTNVELMEDKIPTSHQHYLPISRYQRGKACVIRCLARFFILITLFSHNCKQ